MTILLSFVFFVVTIVFSFYIPGVVITNQFLKKNKDNFLLAWAIGTTVFILGTYVSAWIHMPFLYLIILSLCSIYAFVMKKHITFFSLEKIDPVSLGIILLGSFAFLFLSITSGILLKNGMQFAGLNAVDGITHLAYIKNQALYFPPQHPEQAGELLRGYHYFYDFLLSRFILFFHLSPEDLLFRFFPLYISLLYGFSFYFLTKKLTKTLLSLRLVLYLVYFGAGFSFFISFIQHNFNPLTAQPMDIILDPSFVLGLGLFIPALLLLPFVKKSIVSAVFVGLLIGVLSQIKVYIGLTAIGTIVLYALIEFLRSSWAERGKLLTMLIIVAILTAVTFLPNNINSGRFILAPFNFYDQFMQQPFFLFTHWGLIEAIYKQHHNIPRLILMTIESVIIFWILNIGVRIIILIKGTSLLKKDFWKSEYNTFLLTAIIISAVIPSIFLQSPSPFEVMQFTWITIIFLGIPTGIVIGNTIDKTSKLVKLCTICALILLTIPYAFALEYYYLFPASPAMFTTPEIGVFNTMKNDVNEHGYYVMLPDRLTYTTKTGVFVDKLLWNIAPITTAMVGRSAYYEGTATPFGETEVQKIRIKQMFAISNSLKRCDILSLQQVLRQVKSSYLLTYYPQKCLSTSSAVLKKVETSNYSYYHVQY